MTSMGRGRPPKLETAQAWLMKHVAGLFDRRTRRGKAAAALARRVGEDRLGTADLEVLGVTLFELIRHALEDDKISAKDAFNELRGALEFVRKSKKLDGQGGQTMPGNLVVILPGAIDGSDDGDELIISG